jgi:DNA-3-methyladenine glycosylase I
VNLDPPPPRCEWATMSDLMIAYHDQEWGVPVHDDRTMFEYLVLDGFQAGLSWQIVLKKRDAFREAFLQFDPKAVAAMTDRDVESLLAMPAIVRNGAKIRAAVANAQALLATSSELGSFVEHLWSFTGGEPIQNRWTSWKDIPAQTEQSVALSVDLKRRGFKFVGPTIVYAVMQSAGLVNDHVVHCFRHAEIAELA